METAALILPHQLFSRHPSIGEAETVYLVEEDRYFTEFRFHKKKLLFHRATMQYFRDLLRERGYRVEYLENRQGATLDDLFSRLKEEGIGMIRCAEITDRPLEKRLFRRCEKEGVTLIEDASPAFLTPREEISRFLPEEWRYSMARFYRFQRTRMGILIDGEGRPVGGRWSYDALNRSPLPPDITIPPPPPIPENRYLGEARGYVEERYANNPGTMDGFFYPVTHEDAEAWFEHFLSQRLASFGTFEDAMRQDEAFLFHSALSPLLNSGLLLPESVVIQTLRYAENYEIPINSLEGFIRQIIGWREYIRAVYLLSGEEIRAGNYWDFWHRMPDAFYTAKTGVLPVDTVIRRVREHAYAPHIERLMVLGNFMLLSRIDPDEVYGWFMEHFIDAYDWVMVPNVYGMSQFADGGQISTKPYISGSHYLRRMSDFPAGEWCDIWDGLFWLFVENYHQKIAQNPRLGVMVAAIDRMDDPTREGHFSTAQAYLQELHGSMG